jgi:hypothetical protein
VSDLHPDYSVTIIDLRDSFMMSKITPSVDSTGEGLATLPYPASTKYHLSQPLLSVAGYAVTIDVLPPSHTLLMQPKKSGLKVLYGSMSGRQALNVPPFTASSTTTEDTSMAADENTGAVILRFNPVGETSTWSETADVPVQTTFDVLEFEPRRFIRVDQLPWGKNPKFEGKDFYNLTGFSFQFEDGKKLAHLQFWTAGMVPRYMTSEPTLTLVDRQGSELRGSQSQRLRV